MGYRGGTRRLQGSQGSQRSQRSQGSRESQERSESVRGQASRRPQGRGNQTRNSHPREIAAGDHQAQRRRLREQRLRRVRRMRMMMGCGLLAVALLTTALVWGRLQGKDSEAVPAGAALGDMDDTERLAEEEELMRTGSEGPAAPEDTRAPKSWEGNLPEIGAIYGIYVNEVGWSHFFADASYCMAPVDKHITAFRATVHNQPKDMTGTIEYSVNLSGSGWLDWTEDAGEGGDSAAAMPLEAISMRLTGELGEHYDILYSVLQNQAWTDWVRNGEEAGASGVGLRVDGFRISIVKKQENGISYAAGIDPTKPMIALTYDDGPSASATPRILASLKEHGGKATFFMVGKQAEKNMGIVKLMTEQGSEVANHTYDHKLMTKVPPEELASQLARANQIVSDASGISPVLMRPCGGAQNDAGMNVVGAISMPAVLWSIDTLDWKTRDAQNTVKTVLEQVKDGDIILMHDLYDATADASEILIPELVKRGYQLVTVSELASYRGGMLPGKTYSRFRPLAP